MRRGRPPIDPIVRYRSKVSTGAPDKCWPWTGGVDRGGYGVHWNRKKVRATHFGWELAGNGPVPPGMFVCHSCDNPPCQNPAHWFLGSPKDNTADMIAKGRLVYGKGDSHGNRVLSSAEVLEIFRNPDDLTQAERHRRYGVSRATISLIVNGRAWCDVTGFRALELGP